jgi:cytidine deaminase
MQEKAEKQAENLALEELVAAARQARERAYAPYSHFKVGAALRTKSGRLFLAANVENVSYGLTICAERSAAVMAVAAGELDFEAIAIVADTPGVTSPCGACRQFLAEFNLAMPVTMANLKKIHTTKSLAELLPSAFDNEILESGQY